MNDSFKPWHIPLTAEAKAEEEVTTARETAVAERDKLKAAAEK